MEFDIESVDIIVEGRKQQLKLLWGCFIGFFKPMPVTIYTGPVTLNVTETKDIKHIRRQVNAVS